MKLALWMFVSFVMLLVSLYFLFLHFSHFIIFCDWVIFHISFTVESFYFITEIIFVRNDDILWELCWSFVLLCVFGLYLFFDKIDAFFKCWSIGDEFIFRFDSVDFVNFLVFTVNSLIFIKKSLFFTNIWLD